MKLEKILDSLNSLEKNSFIKIIDQILSNDPKHSKEIDRILSGSEKELKSVDSEVITKIFNLVEDEFSEIIQEDFYDATSQLDILSDILIRDGNCIMKQDWFARLYDLELKKISKKVKEFNLKLDDPKSDISDERIRDFNVYKACLKTAYQNDIDNNREPKITSDELTILHTLSSELELSQESVKLINYMIVPINKMPIESIINELKSLGVIFYSKKSNIVYVSDEIVRVLRKIRGKKVAAKFFRRVLRLLKPPQINLICKKHNISLKLSINEKIKEIINEGISFPGALINDVHKYGTHIPDKKKWFNEFCNVSLNIKPPLRGLTLEDKVESLIAFFESVEKDDKVSISIDGFEKLLIDLYEILPRTNNLVRAEFELQEENVLSSEYLINYNIMPRDILDLMPIIDLNKLCQERNIKTRGDMVSNILSAYKDTENIYLENFQNIGYRNYNALKDNGIIIREAQIGLKFEELTKIIFKKLGFNVDEKLKKSINTSKDKIDILLNLGNNELILIECKTVKGSGYNKFSSVSRQMKSYLELAKKNDYRVIKSLLIAPEFSDEFVNDCELEYDLNLSLITAGSLIQILEGFKKSKKHKQFPYKLLLRDVMIQPERIIKAIN